MTNDYLDYFDYLDNHIRKKRKKIAQSFVDRNAAVVSLHTETVLLCWRGSGKEGKQRWGNDSLLLCQRTREMG